MDTTPSTKPAAAPVIKNVATAPFVVFDGAPVFGHNAGLVEVTLTARVLGLKSDNTVAGDVIAAAHLRCSLQAAATLRDALDKALAIAADAAKEPKH